MNAPTTAQESSALALAPRISDGCIAFDGGRNAKGYGYAQFGGRQYLAHRLAFALNEFLHPDALHGIVIRHRCDNPSCINVEHLEPGSTQDNVNDKVARGRHPRGSSCSYAKLSEEDVAEIRRVYVPRHPELGQHALARRFSVSQPTISLALSGKNWSHTNPEQHQ